MGLKVKPPSQQSHSQLAPVEGKLLLKLGVLSQASNGGALADNQRQPQGNNKAQGWEQPNVPPKQAPPGFGKSKEIDEKLTPATAGKGASSGGHLARNPALSNQEVASLAEPAATSTGPQGGSRMQTPVRPTPRKLRQNAPESLTDVTNNRSERLLPKSTNKATEGVAWAHGVSGMRGLPHNDQSPGPAKATQRTIPAAYESDLPGPDSAARQPVKTSTEARHDQVSCFFSLLSQKAEFLFMC